MQLTLPRAAGGLRYVHLACTAFPTHMHTGDRSADAIDAGGVLPGYDGILVRDERRSPPERCMLLRVARPGSPQSATQGLARELGWTPERVRDAPCVLSGSATAMADQLQERRDRYGITYVVVPEHDLSAFVPVAARLAGT